MGKFNQKTDGNPFNKLIVVPIISLVEIEAFKAP